MPCSLCNSEDEEQIICKGCFEYFKSLKCENCSKNVVSTEKFYIFCNLCHLNKHKETIQNLKKEFQTKKEQKEKELEKLMEKEIDFNKENEEIKKELEKKMKEEALMNYTPIYDDKKTIDFYDIILKINSIRDVLSGWKIEFSKNGKENYEKMKTKDFLKIGVVGLGNKGKTFLLQKLVNIELPSGTSIKTEGLSIKCHDINSENKNIILIDSAGSDSPLVED